jgi:hypothetical protein
MEECHLRLSAQVFSGPGRFYTLRLPFCSLTIQSGLRDRKFLTVAAIIFSSV